MTFRPVLPPLTVQRRTHLLELRRDAEYRVHQAEASRGNLIVAMRLFRDDDRLFSAFAQSYALTLTALSQDRSLIATIDGALA